MDDAPHKPAVGSAQSRLAPEAPGGLRGRLLEAWARSSLGRAWLSRMAHRTADQAASDLQRFTDQASSRLEAGMHGLRLQTSGLGAQMRGRALDLSRAVRPHVARRPWSLSLAVLAATVLTAGLVLGLGRGPQGPEVSGAEAARLEPLSQKALEARLSDMDPAMRALVLRFDPARRGAETSQARDADAGFELVKNDLGEAPVFKLQALSAETAVLVNASMPISTLPNPAARPFLLAARSTLDQTRALDCLTAAVYYEAATESRAGQQAVAQVILNRMRHPAFPKSVCGVVFQGSNRTTGCQFSFTCDGSLSRRPQPELWARAGQVAAAALAGHVMKDVGHATHYHAIYVAPYWSPTLIKVAKVGLHVFYRWTGGWGLPAAFAGQYAGAELAADQMELPILTPVDFDMTFTADGRAVMSEDGQDSGTAAEPEAAPVQIEAAAVDVADIAEAAPAMPAPEPARPAVRPPLALPSNW